MVMLNRKLWRELAHMRGQAIAIGLIVASAVATYLTMRGAYESVSRAQSAYYEQYRFGDVFASLKRAPETVARRIRAIPGVAAVDTRVVLDVTLDVPALREPASGRILSIPDDRTAMLNALHLRKGRFVAPGAAGEALASEAFMRENGFEPGVTISAVINGRWRPLSIVGVAISPELVHEVRPGMAFPDARRFAFLWMSRQALGTATGFDAAFNDLVITLAPGAREKDVIAALDRLLEPYGGLRAYGRDEHPSHRMVRDELMQDRVTAIIIPAVFLAVAAFLIHLVLTRLVASQREQIAVLKAFGYSQSPIVLHYTGFALLIVAAGVAAGTPLGLWLGHGLTSLYTRFFSFPVLLFRLSVAGFLVPVSVSILAAVTASAGAVRRVVALPPAEGMRGEQPPRFTAGLLERLGVHRLVSPPARMILRSLERRPVRTIFSIAGLATASMTLVIGQFTFDALEHMIDMQFRAAQTDDATVIFAEPRSIRAARDLARLPGVIRVEPFRAVPVELRHGHRVRRVAVTGLDRDSTMRRLVDSNGRIRTLPASGLVLTKKLADVLGIRAGETIVMEALEGSRHTRSVIVVSLLEEFIGTSAYASRQELNRFMGEESAISGAHLAVDRARSERLYAQLKKMPGIASVSLREAALASVRETIVENIAISATMLVLFAGVIAFGVIYNGARIALSERGRDLATLRVLGFSRREVAGMHIGEQAVLTAASIPLGFGGGYLLAIWIAAMFDSEVYRIPVIVSGRTFAITFFIIVAAAASTSWLVQRRIRGLDLVEVLKARE